MTGRLRDYEYKSVKFEILETLDCNMFVVVSSFSLIFSTLRNTGAVE